MEPTVYPNMHRIEKKHWWFAGRRQIFATLLNQLYPESRPQIIDIGCGTGGNIDLLEKFGPVLGLEADWAAARLAADGHEGKIAVARFPGQCPLAGNCADLITMFDVLEHIADDQGTLETLHGTLRKSGRIFLSVPAFQQLYGNHDRRLHHFRRYSRMQLSKLLIDSGYELEYISYFNSLLFPFAAVVRLLERFLPAAKPGSAENLPIAPLNLLLTWIFASEALLARRRWRLPFGLTLLAIARKC